MIGPPCACHWCGEPLPVNTGLIAYGFCSDDHRRESNRAALEGLAPAQAQAVEAEEAA